ncbi:unnamed protein product [Linum trigynum]|uniref:Transcriptional regulator n=1 Tax=Linum trigynum TaxID=586398 RepID=A0AAV2DL29_9ROSI
MSNKPSSFAETGSSFLPSLLITAIPDKRNKTRVWIRYELSDAPFCVLTQMLHEQNTICNLQLFCRADQHLSMQTSGCRRVSSNHLAMLTMKAAELPEGLRQHLPLS